MQHRTEQALINGAIAFLGAIAIGIKVVEGVNAWLRWQVKGEPSSPW